MKHHFAPACAAMLLAGSAFAGPTAPPVRAEVEALLDKLQASGCQFNRNGSWYSAADAKKHLLGKLDYVEKSSATIGSTEQFIELAGAKSSASGKPYQVKCGNDPVVESQLWLTRQLATMRGAAGKAKP